MGVDKICWKNICISDRIIVGHVNVGGVKFMTYLILSINGVLNINRFLMVPEGIQFILSDGIWKLSDKMDQNIEEIFRIFVILYKLYKKAHKWIFYVLKNIVKIVEKLLCWNTARSVVG